MRLEPNWLVLRSSSTSAFIPHPCVWLRHPHYLLGYLVCFALVFVIRCTDLQLGLDDCPTSRAAAAARTDRRTLDCRREGLTTMVVLGLQCSELTDGAAAVNGALSFVLLCRERGHAGLR